MANNQEQLSSDSGYLAPDSPEGSIPFIHTPDSSFEVEVDSSSGFSFGFWESSDSSAPADTDDYDADAEFDSSDSTTDQPTDSENYIPPTIMPIGFGNFYGPNHFPDIFVPYPYYHRIPLDEIPDHPLTYEEIVSAPGFKPSTDFVNIPICLESVPDSTKPCGFRTEVVDGLANAVLNLKVNDDGSFEIPEELQLGSEFPITFGMPNVLPNPFAMDLIPNFPEETATPEASRSGPAQSPNVMEMQLLEIQNSATVSSSEETATPEASSSGPAQSPNVMEMQLLETPNTATASSYGQPTTTARQRRRLIRKAQLRSRMPTFCLFCKSNKEQHKFFRSHIMKDEAGKVVCPILRKLICPLCGATEDDAHTKKYCPMFLAKLAEMTEEEIDNKMREPQYAYRVARNSFGVRKSIVRYV